MAWMESIAQKLERERKLREQFPEFEIAPSPDRVMQVDNNNMQNGGSITRFSQAIMQVARHVSELANESGSAPMDVQFTADRLSAGIPGYQTPDYSAQPQKRAGVPLGVAEAFPEEAAGRKVYTSPDELGQAMTSNNPKTWVQMAAQVPSIGAQVLQVFGDLNPIVNMPGAAVRGALGQGSVNPLALAQGAAQGASHPYSSDPYKTGEDILGINRLPSGKPRTLAGVLAQIATDAVGLGLFEGENNPLPSPTRSSDELLQEAVQRGRVPGTDLIDQSAGIFKLNLGGRDTGRVTAEGNPIKSMEYLTPAGRRELQMPGGLAGVAGGAEKPTMADIAALQQRLATEGMTPELQSEIELRLQQLFQPDYNAQPSHSPTASDITVNLRRAREAEGRLPATPRVGFDESRQRIWEDVKNGIYHPEETVPSNKDIVSGRAIPTSLYRAMSDAELANARKSGVFSSGHDLYFTADPDRLSGGAYGAKGGGAIVEFDPFPVQLASARHTNLDELVARDVPFDNVKKIWSWDPERNDHVLTFDRSKISGGAEMSRAEMMDQARKQYAASQEAAKPQLTPEQERSQMLLDEAKAKIQKFGDTVEEYKGWLDDPNITADEREVIQSAIDAQNSAIWRWISRASQLEDEAKSAGGAHPPGDKPPLFSPQGDSMPSDVARGKAAKPEGMGPITRRNIAEENAAAKAKAAEMAALNAGLSRTAPSFSERATGGGKGMPTNVPPLFRPKLVPLPGEGGGASVNPAAMYRSGLAPLEVSPKSGMTVSDLLSELAAAPMSLNSSFDNSFGLRQGAMYVAGHPISAIGTFKDSFKAMFSEQGFKEIQARLQNQPWAAVRDKAGVVITDPSAKLNQREEMLASSIFDFIPGYRNSQRAFSAFGNVARDDLFEKMLRQYGPGWDQIPEDELKRWGRLINVSTGRGSLPAFLANNKVVGQPIFWAPRLLASRFQMPFELFSSSGIVRKEAARQLLSFVGVNMGLLAAVKASGAADVELSDPRSADWGQIKMGNKRIDPWAGYRPIVNLIARMMPTPSDITDASSVGEAVKNLTTGAVTSTNTGETYDKSDTDIIKDFLRGKLSPVAGAVVNAKWGDMSGNKPSLRETALNLVTPLFLKDIYDAYQEDGGKGVLATLPGFFGAGTSDYPPSDLQQALDAKGLDYRGATRAGKAQILNDNPDIANLVSQERIGRGGDTGALEQMRVNFRQAQEQDDTAVQSGNMNWSTWKDNRSTRANQLIGAAAITYGDKPIENPKDGYERWLNEVRAIKGTDGVMTSDDWDRVDEWIAQQSPADQQNIADSTGLYGTQLERDRRAVSKQLDAKGFFDLRDQAWKQLQQENPGKLDQWKSYYDWRDAELRDLTEEMIAKGVPKETAATEAQAALDKYKTVDKFNTLYRTEYRHRFVVDNKDLALQAVYYDYFTPDTAERKFLRSTP